MIKLFRRRGQLWPTAFSQLPARQRFLAGAAAFAVGVAVVSAAVTLWPHQATKQVTAYFPETTGLYAGDRVMVLGVPVGRVESITPDDGRIKVVMSYDAHIPVPADARAAIIAPTLVTTRSVQLSPGYRGGPLLADGAVIPEPRTAVPVEWDQVEKELGTLASSLGPHSGSSGALNKLLTVAAANLGGQGQNMNDTLTALTRASTTLSNDRGDVFATLDNLQKFVSVLAQTNRQVGTFEQRLASVSGTLDGNKTELGQALAALNSSLGTVRGFVAGNRTALARDLNSANGVVGNLAASDQAIANILQIAPTEVANFNNVYDPVHHAVTGALSTANISNPAEFICATIFDAGGTPAQCQQALSPLLTLLRTGDASVSVDPVNRNGYGNHTTPAGGGGTGSKGATSSGASGGASGGSPGGSSIGGGGGLLNVLRGGGS